jgi:hypothetical protein
MVMEYAATCTLQQYLAEVYQRRQDPHNTDASHTYMNVKMNHMIKPVSHSLTREKMVKIACELAAGLAYIHGKKVKCCFSLCL